MRLKRLELQGFKSFLHKTILTFDNTITGVVGPNGCGKSNIVDAIQWVMGEQSASHLRGKSMTDVIFNGSDTQAPTSMAEVSLVLDKTGVALAPAFSAFDKADEIAVTRRVYRDGTGEYFINKTPCRLKDVHELFMDTGVGRRAYSIIEQGQIDRMVNVKPEDRRFLFEEVAGITKYKTKRKEAEKKLELTRTNMVRLQDIVTELEKQIRSLKVQATRARKYKELKSEIETLDLHTLGRNFFNLKRDLQTLTIRYDELTTLRSEADAQFATVDAEVTALELKRLELERSIASLSQRERDLSLKLEQLESQVRVLEERGKFLNQSLEAGKTEEAEIAANIETLEADETQTRAERNELEETVRATTQQIESFEEDLRQKQMEKHRAGEQIHVLRHRKNQIAQRVNTLQNNTQNAQHREQEILQTRTTVQARLEEIEAGLNAQRETLAQAEQKIEEGSHRSSQTSQEVTALSEEVQAISLSLTEAEEKLFDKREQFQEKNSRLQTLAELEANLEGYSPTAREILQRIKGTVNAVPLAEVIQPEAEIEDQLEGLLGETMNTIVVGTTEEAESLVRMIQSQGLERVSIVAISELEAPAHSGSVANLLSPVLNRVRVQPGYEAAAQWCLGNAFLCADPEAMLTMRRAYKDSTIVSSTGNSISHSDRSVSTGISPTKTGVFARRREIEALRVECQALEMEVNQLTTERENLLQHLQTQEKLHTERKDKLSLLHIENVEFRKEKEKIQLELSRAERDSVGFKAELERVDQQLEDNRTKIRNWENELTDLVAQETSATDEMVAAETAIQTLTEEVEQWHAKSNEAKIELSRIEEKTNSIQYRLEKIGTDLEAAMRRKEAIITTREREVRELEEMGRQSEEIVSMRETSNTDRNAVLVDIADAKQAFNETCTALGELKEKSHALQKQRDEVSTEAQETQIKIAHAESQVEQLRGISLERYNREPNPLDETVKVDIEQLPLLKAEVEETWPTLSDTDRDMMLNEHLKSLKEKVARYGEVNLTAIQEFDEIQKRYEFLAEQKTDLENSINILEEAIKKIDESTTTRFQETFEAVNAKFKEIFPILFNGGKAEMTLTNPDSLLESGVDIMVHPPGKRPASISLLSGGEKALTAVSLVLAIFARKPSPFCLLDEVDAPLDDANVSRFNTVVRKMAEKTQFIVITHNKKTMEMADGLYGVTMERSGVSKMTSVALH